MTNPFTPLEWGKTYNLAGVEWVPREHEDGTTAGAIVQLLNELKIGMLYFNERSGYSFVPRPSDNYIGGQEICDMGGINEIWPAEDSMPILPSPARINQQSDPRAVAIAALGLAGFVDEGAGHVLLEITSDAHIAINCSCTTRTVHVYTTDIGP